MLGATRDNLAGVSGTALRVQVCWLRLVQQAPRLSVRALRRNKNRIKDYSCIGTKPTHWRMASESAQEIVWEHLPAIGLGPSPRRCF